MNKLCSLLTPSLIFSFDYLVITQTEAIFESEIYCCQNKRLLAQLVMPSSAAFFL